MKEQELAVTVYYSKQWVEEEQKHAHKLELARHCAPSRHHHHHSCSRK